MEFSTNHDSTQDFKNMTTEELIEICDNERIVWPEKAAALRRLLTQVYGYGDNLAFRSRFYDRIVVSVLKHRSAALRVVFACMETASNGRRPDRMFAVLFTEEAEKCRLEPFYQVR